MKRKVCIFSICLAAVLFATPSLANFATEEELSDFLKTVYEKNASASCTIQNIAEWNFATDVSNPEKEQIVLTTTLEEAENRKYFWERFFQDLKPEDFQTEAIRRQVKSLRILGSAALDTEKLTQLTNIQTNMTNIYSTARICPFNNQNCNLATEGLTLDPDIETIISTSSNYDELVYVWTAWRNATGAKIRNQFGTYVDLSNEAARANHFADMGEMWRDNYETENFIERLDKLWDQVRPLYDELHTYVSRKLKNKFGDQIDISDGLLPANILGNMWGQSWTNLGSLVKPYPNASEVDVTSALIKQNYTILKMFETSDDFYKSLGLEDNSISYNVSAGAMIEKPTDRDVLCHASAWDFCDGENFRIKMCTGINFDDFITVHHEMGHIQYYLLYKNQPITFRTGANPGFHEAVGDTIALSVSTPQHLEKIGLLKDYVDNEESSINALMDMALERISFLPFGLLIDKWRWDVFSKNIGEDKWNAHWWHYRKTIQKLKPPVARTENDFDPGAKYHVAGDTQYINYFVAHILQFQLYRGLCIVAGEYDPKSTSSKPLHKCDYYQNKAAGDKLRAGLSLGASKHWTEALIAMTGETDLDASALLDYFAPLYKFLKEQNNNAVKMAESELEEFLAGEYAREAQKVTTASVVANWNLKTDLTNPANEEAQLNTTLELAAFRLRKWTEVFQHLNPEDYKQEIIRRQVRSLNILGNAALDTEKLTQFTNVISNMTSTYSTAKICPFDNQNCNLETEGLNLDPGIEEIISTSTNYDELVYAWTAWRNVSGVKIRDQYQQYVNLSNEAAKANGFTDRGEMWRDSFETPTFIADLEDLWEQVSPLYFDLHNYVGSKLKERFGDRLDLSDGLIPAHVFGNMWAQSWINLIPLVKPFPNASTIDVTAALNKQNYTVLKMFETSDKFYLSLGLEDNSISYNISAGAMIEKPTDREVVCHASAWDFYDGENFRIKMCTKINYEDFITVHHEMGHIQYFLLYKDQPITLRSGANPGFHEAVGDTIALSVATPAHLQKIGLLENYEDNDESSINSLMDMALERVAFLPFGYLIDKFRWDVFSGNASYSEWNARWWHYRETIQRVKAPVPRTENDFDPGAKFHVPGDSQYISYFVAHILEFQLYKALCIESGQYDPIVKDPPLHKCDYYQSIEAGKKLRAGLSLGASRHWKDALEAMTGERDLDASAILEYFEPLHLFLKQKKAEGVISSKCPEKSETPSDQTVPISVGAVLGCFLICSLGFYGYKRYHNKQ